MSRTASPTHQPDEQRSSTTPATPERPEEIQGRVVYELDALKGYKKRAAGDKADQETRLDALLAAVQEVSLIFESSGIPPAKWFIRVFAASFQTHDNSYLSGRELLEEIEQSYNDLSLEGAEPLTIVDAFREAVSETRSITIPRSFEKAELGTLELPRQIKEVLAPFEASVQELEKLIDDIFEYHFSGDPFEFTPGVLESTEYKFRSGLVLTGKTILESYCIAKWRRDFPNEHPERSRILSSRHYKPEDVMLEYRKRAIQKLLAKDSFTTIGIPSSLNKINTLTTSDLESIAVTAIKEIQNKDSNLLSVEHASLLVLSDSDGQEVSLIELLRAISISRHRDKYPEKEVSKSEIIQKRGYRFGDVLRSLSRLCSESSKSIAQMSDEELVEYASKTSLSPILEILTSLGNSPGVIIETLKLLEPEASNEIALEELIPRYVGLQVQSNRSRGSNGDSGATQDSNLSNSFVMALLQLASQGKNTLELNDQQFSQALQIAIRCHRRTFESDPVALLKQLGTEVEELSNTAKPMLTPAQQEIITKLLVSMRQHFSEILNEDLSFMKTPPFQYQKEGVRFLRMRDQALLADEAGLAKTYQAVAAALCCNYKTLYITPTSTVTNVRDEILEHTHLTEDNIAIITSESPQKRREQIEALDDETFVIVGYETLAVIYRDSPELFQKLCKGIDLKILDEAHTPENIDTIRGEAVRALDIPNSWYLTATPYRSGIAGIFWILNSINPHEYPNEKLFNEQYCQNLGGLYQLHQNLQHIMLRRIKADTVSYFEDPEVKPFSQQLEEIAPRVPQQRIIPPEEEGMFELMPAQEQTIMWMVSDFKGWATHYNENIAPQGEYIDIDTINPLLKFQFIHKAIYEPEYLGLPAPETLYRETDRSVINLLNEDKKGILWVQRHLTADTLSARYHQIGHLKLDGRIHPRERLELINRHFQEDPDCKILVANQAALSTGVTITAAHKAIMVQPTWTPSEWVQTLGRHQRVIGREKQRFAKMYADTVVLIPCYSDAILRSIDDPDLREIMERGTLPSQTFSRIQGGRVVFQVVTEGYRDEVEFQRQFQSSLLKSMGLVEHKQYDVTTGVKPQTRSMYKVAEILYPLWEANQGDDEVEAALTRLISQAKFHSDAVLSIAETIKHTETVDPAALQFISSIFELKNRAIREQLLEFAPWMLTHREEFNEVAGKITTLDAEESTASILKILPLMLTFRGTGDTPKIDSYLAEASRLNNSPESRDQRKKLLFGLIHLMKYPAAVDALEKALPDKSTALQHTLSQIIGTTYQFGQICRYYGELPDEYYALSEAHFSAFTDMCTRGVNRALEEFCEVESGSVDAMLSSDPVWEDSVDHLLSLITGWMSIEEESKRTELLSQAKEVFSTILGGDYSEWRKRNDPQAGTKISFRSKDDTFWDKFNENTSYTFESVELRKKLLIQSIQDEYRLLKREIYSTAKTLEGPQVTDLYDVALKYHRSNTVALRRHLEYRRDTLRAIEKRVAINKTFSVTSDETLFLKQEGVNLDNPKLADISLKRIEIERAIGWTTIEQSISSLNSESSNTDMTEALRALQRKKHFYDGEAADHISFALSRVSGLLEEYTTCSDTKTTATVSETTHPALISKMGSLSPRLINCFNPDADPYFTQWVLGALASRNFKLLVVKEGDSLLAWAPMKVRKTLNAEAESTPNLFLERGLSVSTYNFRPEMLELIAAKGKDMEDTCETPVDVSYQIFGRANKDDIRVQGTGAYTRDEYAEAVFHLRRAKSVIHTARLYDPERFLTEQEEQVVAGYGTAKQSIDEVVNGLIRSAATLVVDIRPGSRRKAYQKCSREKLEAALKGAQIEYLYAGDTLGNPGAGSGSTAYSAYRTFMQTEKFNHEAEQLAKRIQDLDGQVIILGAQSRQRKCPRNHLIKYLKEILASGEIR